ncbi:MAG: hypothetical protein H8E28_14640 [Anaerolineae bacterium]|nr:hypothetical protein [Anaerolineae bacterium]
MKAAQAWQAALGQLQLEMPKAAFDTWVRDTEFIGFDDETGTLTISCWNAYARDWLEDRLTSTVKKLLAGIMNGEVTVQFVVHNDIVADEREDDDANDDSETSSVEAVYDLPHDEIVGTGVIPLPGYFANHIADLGPTLAWLVVGFRQVTYLAGQRSGNRMHRISERQLALWSGTYRKRFRRFKDKPETWQALQGFVSLEDTTASWEITEGRGLRRRAHVYKVQMTMPLTAAHAHALELWLLQNVETAGGPKEVIELALTISPRALLSDVAVPSDGAIRKTVPQILAELFSEQLSEGELKTLSHRLHYHIMPHNDLIVLTHFFVRNLVSVLGHGPAWMLTLLRDRCYVDPETGEQRNEVTLQNGWKEIANWLGIKQPMTVWRWLHGTKRSTKKTATIPPLSIFVHEAKTGRASGFATGKRTFHLSPDELPPAILAQIDEYSKNMDWGKAIREIIARMTPSGNDCIFCNCANDPIMIARMTPDVRANDPIVIARMTPDVRANDPILSSLNSLKTSSLSSNKQNIHTGEPDKITPNSKTSQVGGFGDDFLVWDWEFLFAYNPEIAPQDQDLLKDRNPGRFAAWLIYGYSKKGQGLDNPVIFAVRRVQQGKAEPAEFVRFRTGKLDYLYDQLAYNMDDKLLPQDDKTRTILRKRLFGPKS